MSGLWWLVIGMGAITYALRLLPILLLSGNSEPPVLLQRGLRLVPAAVLSALILPELVLHDGPALQLSAGPRLLAGTLAALVAWRTKNVALTLICGMLTLWIASVALAWRGG